jgi:heme A synthase
VQVGGVQVRREQFRRGIAAGAGLALLAAVAVARRQARTRRRSSAPT